MWHNLKKRWRCWKNGHRYLIDHFDDQMMMVATQCYICHKMQRR